MGCRAALARQVYSRLRLTWSSSRSHRHVQGPSGQRSLDCLGGGVRGGGQSTVCFYNADDLYYLVRTTWYVDSTVRSIIASTSESPAESRRRQITQQRRHPSAVDEPLLVLRREQRAGVRPAPARRRGHPPHDNLRASGRTATQ
jgi:hypothetical protein